jgi:hypothetical protein
LTLLPFQPTLNEDVLRNDYAKIAIARPKLTPRALASLAELSNLLNLITL